MTRASPLVVTRVVHSCVVTESRIVVKSRCHTPRYHAARVQVPEEYRMFAEHRVHIEVDNTPERRKQGRTKTPPPLLPTLAGVKSLWGRKSEPAGAASIDSAEGGEGADDEGGDGDGDGDGDGNDEDGDIDEEDEEN